MDRTRAYVTLAAELERWRRLPFDHLISLVGAPPTVKSAPIGNEMIDVEVRVKWAGDRRHSIRVEATANGPSCWKLERLEEAITVPARDSSERG